MRGLFSVVDRARERFGLREVCFVADRGMASEEVIAGLEERGLGYILGMRLRGAKEVRDVVLSHPGRYEVVEENLKVKEVRVRERRYVVCLNPEEANKDAQDREVILAGPSGEARGWAQGPGGEPRVPAVPQGGEGCDPDRPREGGGGSAVGGGSGCSGTNTDLPAAEVARQYKRLLTVERFFRAAKGLLKDAADLAQVCLHDPGAHLRELSCPYGEA